MRTLSLAVMALAAFTIAVPTASAEHARRPASYCAPGGGVTVHRAHSYGGYPGYAVRSYQTYRLPTGSAARYHAYKHQLHHLHTLQPYHSVHQYHGHSPYGTGYNSLRVGVHTGSFGIHIGF